LVLRLFRFRRAPGFSVGLNKQRPRQSDKYRRKLFLPKDLTKLETHFAFGQNWSDYSDKIRDEQIVEAKNALQRLLGNEALAGKRFLDIGCGSGLHSLAALQLGAAEVVAMDLDPESVNTTERVLRRFAPAGASYRVIQRSVFDLNIADLGSFDVTYSWGVLHHTGKMYEALVRAGAMTAPSGLFVFALYRKTWLCRFWTIEKRWYAAASAKRQEYARRIYIRLFRIGLLVTGRRFAAYEKNYRSNRGMDFYHDVHDWMGGYPYESISNREVDDLMTSTGFQAQRLFLSSTRKILGRNVGFFGSGCDEYVYIRKGSSD
jgi:2-polyprenyl-3-methyl-5-hydroxy-6-metoxy-1,4-benzoquinol methylase